jgi:hypothetical protein
MYEERSAAVSMGVLPPREDHNMAESGIRIRPARDGGDDPDTLVRLSASAAISVHPDSSADSTGTH